jgi:o-succinylbenzoate---CoA ligase
VTLSVFDAARDEPDRLALVAEGARFTYLELARRVERRLSELHAAGALDPAGRRAVGVVARPTLASIETLLALFAAGTPVLLLHPRGTPSERDALLTRSGALREPPRGATETPGPTPTLSAFDPERIAAILPTSGTTGAPRLSQLSHRALVAAVRAATQNLGIEDDRALLALPLAHVGGLSVLARALGNRRALVLFEPQRSLLGELDRFVACAAEHAVTVISLVPTVLERLLAPPIAWRPPASLRALLLGGAGIPRSLVARARAAGIPVMPTYGLTETCAQAVTCRYTDRLAPVAAGHELFPSGVPIAGVQLRLNEGLIEIHGPTLFSGYLGDPATVLGDGWLSTQDRGFIDPQGELVVTGRASDLIITGGENVDPLEVEAALASLPGVKQACVFGISDPTFGEIVTAVLLAEPGGPTSVEAVAERLSGRLARFKLPRRVETVTDELPLTPAGKIDRRAARALFPLAR